MSLSDLMIDYQTEVAEKGDYVHNQDEMYKDFGEYVSKVMSSDEYKRDMDEYHEKFDDKFDNPMQQIDDIVNSLDIKKDR